MGSTMIILFQQSSHRGRVFEEQQILHGHPCIFWPWPQALRCPHLSFALLIVTRFTLSPTCLPTPNRQRRGMRGFVRFLLLACNGDISNLGATRSSGSDTVPFLFLRFVTYLSYHSVVLQLIDPILTSLPPLSPQSHPQSPTHFIASSDMCAAEADQAVVRAFLPYSTRYILDLRWI